jgi:uncharacterized protein
MGDISNEPSMEDILSSIKKIIAEDSTQALSASRPRRPAPRDSRFDALGAALPGAAPQGDETIDDDDVLELTEATAMPETATESPHVDVRPVEVRPVEVSATETTSAVVPAPVVEAAAPAELVSGTTAAVSRSALAQLSALVVKPETVGSDTLEGLVRDMLRPMLKDWLDARLPDLVEAMVAREIARISGRVL